MDEDIIDTLEIEIKSKVTNVDKSLNKLSKSLNELKTVAKGGANLTSVTKQIEKFSNAVNNIPKLTKLKQIKDILQQFQSIGNVKINIGDKLKDNLSSVSGAASEAASEVKEAVNIIDTSVNGNVEGLRSSKTKNDKSLNLRDQMELEPFKDKIDISDDLANLDKIKKYVDLLKGSFSGATKKVSKFVDAFKRIVRYKVVSTILNFISKSLKDGINNLYQFSKETDGSFAKSLDSLATSMNYFTNSLGTALAPILETMIPYLTQLLDGIATLFDKIAEIGAAAQGKDVYYSATKSAKEYAEAADKAKKATIGFDEINVLSSAKQNGPDFEPNTPVSDTAKMIGENLGNINSYAGIALFAVGALIFFSSMNVAGLKMMALGLGVSALGAKVEWDNAEGDVKKQIGIIMKCIGWGAFAIGLMLTLSGIGAAAGIPLMIGGLGLALGGMAMTTEASDKVKTILGAIMVVAGGLLAAIGLLICFTGAGLPIGIAMIIGGAGMLIGGAATIDWNYLGEKIKEVLQSIGNWLKDNSKVIIGVLLCFTGAGLPIGIAMLIDANKSGEKSIDFNAFGEKLKSVWDNITNWAKTKVLPIFTPNYWLKKFNVITDAFKKTFEAITGFKIKLPHFKIEPEGWNPGDLFKGVIPKLDIQWYANGGYPDAGQLFVAREAGPEMVGKIGGRNAVANNDQIVAAIEQGVFRAMTAAGGTSSGGGDWTIQIVDGNGNITAETIITSAQRKNRRDGKTVIPVGV